MSEFTPSMLLIDKFKTALAFVIEHEGGDVYTVNPADPGGATRYGISKKAYPDLDIAHLTLAKASEIYYRDFWSRCHVDDYDYPIALAVFDSAVNCGVSKAQEWARECHGCAEKVLFLRTMHYMKLIQKNTKLKLFINGWLNRIVDCFEEGKRYE